MINRTQHDVNIINKTIDYNVEPEQIDKNAFSQFYHDKLKQYNDKNKTQLSTRKLAAIFNITYDVFRKIINKEKPTKKRDLIIAICVVLKLSSPEIDQALELYYGKDVLHFGYDDK